VFSPGAGQSIGLQIAKYLNLLYLYYSPKAIVCMFSGLSAENIKKNSLCALCAFAVNIFNFMSI
jgi:hypothetical protein